MKEYIKQYSHDICETNTEKPFGIIKHLNSETQRRCSELSQGSFSQH